MAQVRLTINFGIGALKLHQPRRQPESAQPFGHRQAHFAFNVFFACCCAR